MNGILNDGLTFLLLGDSAIQKKNRYTVYIRFGIRFYKCSKIGIGKVFKRSIAKNYEFTNERLFTSLDKIYTHQYICTFIHLCKYVHCTHMFCSKQCINNWLKKLKVSFFFIYILLNLFALFFQEM